jgi:hypothetical protein
MFTIITINIKWVKVNKLIWNLQYWRRIWIQKTGEVLRNNQIRNSFTKSIPVLNFRASKRRIKSEHVKSNWFTKCKLDFVFPRRFLFYTECVLKWLYFYFFKNVLCIRNTMSWKIANFANLWYFRDRLQCRSIEFSNNDDDLEISEFGGYVL